MPLFDDINLKTIEQDGELFVNAHQLAWHLTSAMKEFYEETMEISKEQPLLSSEKYFFNGILEGMNSVVLLLAQGGMEDEFNKNVNTVEDFIKRIEETENE
jgi:predicted N-acyltransferase